MTEIEVHLPNPLRPFAGGAPRVAAHGATVLEALHDVETRHPGLGRYLWGPGGTLRRNIAVFLNDVDVRELDGVSTPLKAGDQLALVPSLSGGSSSTDPLSAEERDRYGRHLRLPQVGEAGQRRLRDARVLLIGTGGLGAPAALYLAAAGVGTLGLVDFDRVELSNLQRQVLFETPDLGQAKVEVAVRRLTRLNPEITIEPIDTRLTSENALELVRRYDVILDGSDNFATRYLVNDACVLAGKPDVFASVYRFEGQATVFDGLKGPCYRCLFPEPPPPELAPSCSDAGVLGVLPGLLGVVMATETVKLLLEVGDSLVGRLLLYDALTLRFRELAIRKDPRCVVCGTSPTLRALLPDYGAFCGDPSEPDDGGPEEIDAADLRRQLGGGEPPLLIDVREVAEWARGHIDGATSVPFDELNARSAEVDPAQSIVVYCQAGHQSLWATRLLRSKGFRQVHSLRGGFEAWASSAGSAAR